MLMRLGRWLRLVGLDVANPEDADDPELLLKARKEDRTLITRDRGLNEGCRNAGVKCILIESTCLQDQLREMAKVGVNMKLNPKRCTVCNSPLRETVKELGYRSKQETTWECEGCGKLYWAGSHWKKIEDTLEKIRSERVDS